MEGSDKRKLIRIGVALALFIVGEVLKQTGAIEALAGEAALPVEFAIFFVPYLIAGYDVLLLAARGIGHGQVFDENFLMSIATIGAFALVAFPEAEPHMAEGAAVMLFYQVGEFFQDYAVGKTRGSISEMMDIAPDVANVLREGEIVEVDPCDVEVGDTIVVKPGERVPLDGRIVQGATQLDTSALTGESAPRSANVGDEVASGCINQTGLIHIEVDRPYDQSTVQRILELVEEASERKARTERFITRFARYYTPAVVGLAAAIAVLYPLLTATSWAKGVESALIFLVVSCPCALVISVPLSFFGGIGAASRQGILVKGSSYLETLGSVATVVFDKTGTLTKGSFEVVDVACEPGVERSEMLALAAAAEQFSTHPIAQCVREAAQREHPLTGETTTSNNSHDPLSRPSGDSSPLQGEPYGNDYGMPGSSPLQGEPKAADVTEIAGRGVAATVGSRRVLVGNDTLMAEHGIAAPGIEAAGTVLHVAVIGNNSNDPLSQASPDSSPCEGEPSGTYLGHILIADVPKADAHDAICGLHAAGVKRCIMLTGDREQAATEVARELGLDAHYAQLLPADKVTRVEELLAQQNDKERLAFVGDGINDAPVLMRADVGIAMGALGSDAAIEAADIVLMDDKPSHIATAIRIARKTMRIVWQNIVFALGVKVLIMVLALPFIGIANMWLAVFGDVGVACLAILNSMRALKA